MASTSETTSNAARNREARSRRRRGRRAIFGAVGVLLVLAIVAAVWPDPIQVELAKVTRGPLTVSVLEEGQTRIPNRYIISATVAGMLERIELRAGARVKAGETVLARIVPEPPALLDPRSRAEAEARIHAAEAALRFRESELERARASLDLAEKEFARANALRESGAISSQEWDIAENRARVAARDVRAAGFASQIAEFELAQARAALMEEAPQGDQPARMIRIVSPVDGYVLQVFEESARTVTPGMPLMEVGDTRDLEAEIELLSSDAVAVQPGAEVTIEHWGGEEPLRGRVSVVEPGGFTKISALGVEEQRVLVRVEFLEPFPPDRQLGDRYRVEARIVTWHGEDVLQVPTGALFRRGGDWMTFAVEDGRARLREVEIAHNNGTAAEVISGLSEGESVILYPPDSVEDGAGVEG